MSEGKLAFFWITSLILLLITIILLGDAWDFQSTNRYLFVPFLILLCVIVGYYFFNKKNIEKSFQQEFSKKLLDAREVEKKKIASELHDGLQQDLHSIDFEIKRLYKTTFTPYEKLENLSKRIIEVIDEVRRISSELYPHQLDKLGLTKALTAMANNLSDSSQAYLSVKIDENIDSLFSQEASIHIYRIIQELFNNIVAHSNATKASLKITTNNILLFIDIEDNGKGFENSFKVVDNSRKGLGLQSVQERLKLMNGSMEVISRIGKGSLFKITIPTRNIYNTMRLNGRTN